MLRPSSPTTAKRAPTGRTSSGPPCPGGPSDPARADLASGGRGEPKSPRFDGYPRLRGVQPCESEGLGCGSGSRLAPRPTRTSGGDEVGPGDRADLAEERLIPPARTRQRDDGRPTETTRAWSSKSTRHPGRRPERSTRPATGGAAEPPADRSARADSRSAKEAHAAPRSVAIRDAGVEGTQQNRARSPWTFRDKAPRADSKLGHSPA